MPFTHDIMTLDYEIRNNITGDSGKVYSSIDVAPYIGTLEDWEYNDWRIECLLWGEKKVAEFSYYDFESITC